MDAYNTGQLNNLQQKLQQLQALMQQPVTPPAPVQPQKVISTVPVVDGLAGARQYHDTLGPSCSAAVFDKEEAAFFLLSVDANGNKAPVKIGRFTLEDAPEPGSNVITKEEFDAFKTEIRGMFSELVKKEATAE